MTEEATEPTDEELGIFDASPLGQDVEAHYAALKLVDRLKPNKAFAIPKEGFSLKVLRELAEDLSTVAKPLVVFEHETVYEVRMLEKGRNPKRFYSYVGKPGEASPIEEADKEVETAILDTIAELLGGSIEDAQRYEPKFNEEWRKGSVVSYSYLHKRNAAKSAFRKSPQGATVVLKTTLAKLIEEGILCEVPPAIAAEAYGSSGQLFRRMKGN